MSPPLSDLQLLVVEQLAKLRERDLLVSAGAGSGKTTILVASVIAAVKAGVPLDRILVVTFTDKAAAEMKNKIHHAMGSDEELSPLRLRLPQARISTIHSFCQRLLRERFERAGVDPRFRVLSDEDAKLLLEDATTRVFHARYEKVGEGKKEDLFGEMVEMCGFDATGERLRAVIRDLLAYARASEEPAGFFAKHLARLRPQPEDWSGLVWREDYAARVVTAWRAAVGALRALVVELCETPAWAATLREVEAVDPATLATPEGQRAVARRLASIGLVEEETTLAIQLPSLPRGEGKRLEKLKDAVKKAFRSEWLTGIPVDQEQVIKDEHIASRFGYALLGLAHEVHEAYDSAKTRNGRLDFEDLQIKALRLIADLAGTQEAIAFERVFVDEFQDVNHLQHRLLSSVCDPTRIFRVGDVKQSIYQFRLAEPSIIRDLGRDRPAVRDHASAPEADPEWNVLLPRNYRSLPPVLDVVNEIARGLFFEEEIGSEYESQALLPGSESPAQSPDVELMLIPEVAGQVHEREVEEEAPVDLRDAEWTAIAKKIGDLVGSAARVRDPESGETRAIRYSDIAILLRAHSRAPSLARRLEENGIPCSLGTGESFFEAAEVRDLMNVLRVIDNALDDIALASILRSPVFQWEDADLLAARLTFPRAMHLAFVLASLADRGSGDGAYSRALLPDREEDRQILCGDERDLPGEPPFTLLPERARACLDSLLRWREAAATSELPDFLSRVLRESGLALSVASLPGGLRRQANLRKFIGLARRHSQDSGHSLSRFIRWLEQLQEGGAKIFEAPVSSESLPAVRILSIHRAKGLEFPVVIVAETGRRYRLGRGSDALAPGREYIGVRLLDPDSYVLRRPLPLRLLIDKARSDELAEEKRVLYVALTRARDRLIVSGVLHKKAAIDEPQLRAFRRSAKDRDATGKAAMQSFLAAKPYALSWILYTLPDIPADGGRVGDLPLQVLWIRPEVRESIPPAPNPIRDIEPILKRHEPVEIQDGPDPAADEAVERARTRPPLPSPGLLPSARGKIWATEFKSGRDFVASFDAEGRSEEALDEPAAPLIAADAAAREGTLLHGVIERLDLTGLTGENLAERITAAAALLGGIPPSTGQVLERGMSALLGTPAGEALTGGEVHREVAFSLRLPLLEVTRWLPQLREEILSSEDWQDWVEEDGTGALRVRQGRTPAAGDPWVLVQGRIDAVVRDREGWLLVDWKSDRVSEGPAMDQRMRLYKGQMEIYRRAAQCLFGAPVRAALFFLRPGVWKEVR